VNAVESEVEREGNNDACNCTTERSAKQNKEFASVCLEERFAEPRTNSTRRDACKHTYLEKKGAHACRSTTAEQTDHEGRGNDAQANERDRQDAGYESDGETNANQQQTDDHHGESDDLHTVTIILSGPEAKGQ
jgi:hypothetical protein